MIGEQSTTCMFGLIVALVCPIMFGIQNLLLGICLFEDSTKNLSYGFCHVLQSMRYQLVVLYDLSLFRGAKTTQMYNCKVTLLGVVRIIVGYILYALPICGLVTLFIFGHANLTLCRSPRAKFLIDNDVLPAVNMSNLYGKRQSFAHELLRNHSDWERNPFKYTGGTGLLGWDFDSIGNRPSYRKNKYWPLDNITDLINQFNYAGFHDMCIYPRLYQDVTSVERNWNLATKGLFWVYHGYVRTNSTGTDCN